MTTITVLPDSVRVSFTTAEKIAGLVGDQEVPRTAIRSAEVVPDGLTAARGLRAPGLGLPGVRKIGTWRRRDGKALVAVRTGRPALRLILEGHRYDELLLDVDDAAALAATLQPTTA